MNRYSVYLAPAGSIGIKAPGATFHSVKATKNATKPRQRAPAPPNAAALGSAASKQRPHMKNNNLRAAPGQGFTPAADI